MLRWTSEFGAYGIKVCSVWNDNVTFPPASRVLATNAKDETHLWDWAAHHLFIGFDRILYIDDHSEHISILEKLPNHLHKQLSIVSLCERSWVPKMKLQEAFTNIACNHKASWTMHLDADEYLILNRVPSLDSWIHTMPSQANQVYVRWLVWGSNYRSYDDANKTMFELYTRRADTNHNIGKSMQRCIGTSWKHAGAHFMTNQKSVRWFDAYGDELHYDASKDVLGSYGQRIPGSIGYAFGKRNKTSLDPVFIAHFRQQSVQTCIKRKVDRKRDNDNEYRKQYNCNHNKEENIVSHTLASVH